MPAASDDPQPAVSFRSDGNVAIHVPDLARAEAFYGGVLGFRLVGFVLDIIERRAG